MLTYAIAVLIYFGIITSPNQATQQIIDQNQDLIENAKESDIVIIDDLIV